MSYRRKIVVAINYNFIKTVYKKWYSKIPNNWCYIKLLKFLKMQIFKDFMKNLKYFKLYGIIILKNTINYIIRLISNSVSVNFKSSEIYSQ